MASCKPSVGRFSNKFELPKRWNKNENPLLLYSRDIGTTKIFVVYFFNKIFVLIFFNDSVKQILRLVQDLERIRKDFVISIHI